MGNLADRVLPVEGQRVGPLTMPRIPGSRRKSVGAASVNQSSIVAPEMKTDQTRTRTEQHAAVITEMLMATTEGKVHIEETNVHYAMGYTDFVLSPDSCNAWNERNIMEWFTRGRIDPFVYSWHKEDVYAPMVTRPQGFTFTPKQRVSTIVVRAQAGRAVVGYAKWLRGRVYLWARLVVLVLALFMLLALIMRV